MVAPPYFDFLIPARMSGQAGPDVHLGYWDAPDTATRDADAFRAAQARLTQRALDLLAARSGGAYLDVACGFGGTLAALAARMSPVFLAGVNIDQRQLHLCRRTMARTAFAAHFIAADACALPFADEAFDHLLCIEAMFHFRSRSAFLAEAARVTRPGGSIVVTDILLRRPVGLSEPALNHVVEVIRRDHGTWPEPWMEQADLLAAAEKTGWTPRCVLDWSRQTLPSYWTVAPPHVRHIENAGTLFWRLQESGLLTYVAISLEKRNT